MLAVRSSKAGKRKPSSGAAAVWPAAAAGAACAVGGALLAQQADAETLRKLFGGFLILVGLSEVFLKGLKKK